MQLAQLNIFQTDLACLSIDIYSVYENNTAQSALKSTTVRDDDFFSFSRPPSI